MASRSARNLIQRYQKGAVGVAKAKTLDINIIITYADGATPESVKARYMREWARVVGAEINRLPPEQRRPMAETLLKLAANN